MVETGGNSVGKALAVQVFSQMPRTQREVLEVCMYCQCYWRDGDQAGESLEPFKLRPDHLSTR